MQRTARCMPQPLPTHLPRLLLCLQCGTLVLFTLMLAHFSHFGSYKSNLARWRANDRLIEQRKKQPRPNLSQRQAALTAQRSQQHIIRHFPKARSAFNSAITMPFNIASMRSKTATTMKQCRHTTKPPYPNIAHPSSNVVLDLRQRI